MSGPVMKVPADVDSDYGECPLLSTVTLIPEQSIAAPNQVKLSPVKLSAPCVGKSCGWWSVEKGHCSVLCVSEVANKLDDLTPSKSGSPLSRIAETLSSMFERQKGKG